MDTLDKGILVFRHEKQTLLLPPCSLLHWGKRLFERLDLRPYR